MKNLVMSIIPVAILFCSLLGISLEVGVYDYPPLCYMERGKFVGIFPELLNFIARLHNWTIKYRFVDFEEGIKLLSEGQLDLLCAVPYSAKGEPPYFMGSESVFNDWAVLFSNVSTYVASFVELDGKKIAIVKGDVHSRAIVESARKFGIHPHFLETEGSYREVMKMVVAQMADVGLVSRSFALYRANMYNVKKIPLILNPVEFHFAAAKKASMVKVLDILDREVADLKRDDSSIYYELMDKYVRVKRQYYPRWLKAVILVFACGITVLYGGFYTLQRMVALRTRQLQEKKEELEAYHQELSAMHEELQLMNVTLNKALEKYRVLVKTVVEMDVMDETRFMKDLLGLTLHLVEEAQGGFVAVDDEGWKVVAGVGYRYDRMEGRYLEKREIMDRIKDIMFAPKDPESVLVPFEVGGRVAAILGLYLPIKRNFEKTLLMLKPLQTLGSSFLTIKNLSKIKGKFQSELIKALVKFIEMRDPYTRGHSMNVARLSAEIAEKMGLDRETIKSVYWAGIVHDVGKIVVRMDILQKPEKLTKEEMDEVRRHPVLGAIILNELEETKKLAKIVKHHHERWDGRGYPDGLKGEEIPLGSRILALADAFDAMRSERPYRRALSLEETLEEIRTCSGTQFDPEVVKVFFRYRLYEFKKTP